MKTIQTSRFLTLASLMALLLTGCGAETRIADLNLDRISNQFQNSTERNQRVWIYSPPVQKGSAGKIVQISSEYPVNGKYSDKNNKILSDYYSITTKEFSFNNVDNFPNSIMPDNIFGDKLDKIIVHIIIKGKVSGQENSIIKYPFSLNDEKSFDRSCKEKSGEKCRIFARNISGEDSDIILSSLEENSIKSIKLKMYRFNITDKYLEIFCEIPNIWNDESKLNLIQEKCLEMSRRYLSISGE